MKNKIIKNNGSIQSINEIPNNIKDIYKTALESGNKTLINMSADERKIYLSITEFKFILWRNLTSIKLLVCIFILGKEKVIKRDNIICVQNLLHKPKNLLHQNQKKDNIINKMKNALSWWRLNTFIS